MSISSNSSETVRTQKAPKYGSRGEISPITVRDARLDEIAQRGETKQRSVAQLLENVIIFTADLNGVVTGCDCGTNLSGIEVQDFIGRNINSIYRTRLEAKSKLPGNSETPKTAEIMTASILEKGGFDAEAVCQTTAGRDLDVHLYLIVQQGQDGLPVSIVGLSIGPVVDAATKSAREKNASGNNGSVPLSLLQRQIDGTQFLIASPIMHKFMGMVDRVAAHTETVLVTGETGTGKELVARTIHESSHRSKNAFIDINCAALPEHLVESELFGYEKGAFSGADSSKPGLFELANRGTIFLDEIGELQPQIQVKLLRVLDGAPFYRLGGNRKITVDVRVVAATNLDLEEAVKEGRFRKDLFHRLGQFQLRVPALRERPDDIAALARHFLALKSQDKSFTSDAMAILQSHPWPGNIRELRNLVAKLAMAVEGRKISASDVAAALSGESATAERATANWINHAVPLGDLDNMEEQMIIRALEQTGGRRAQAAEQLGISRRTLSRKLREYEIDVDAGERSTKLGTISQEQQKFFRAKVNLPVTLRNTQGKELQAEAVNLSTGGLGLAGADDQAGLGGLVSVSFLLPESEIEIQAKGRLVWAEAGGRAGFRFVVMEPALYEKLQQWTNRKMKDEGWETPA